MVRRLSLALILVLSLALPGAGRAQDHSGPPAPDPSWLKWDQATRTVTFKLIAGLTGRDAKSPFNFNGYTDGDLALVVPEGSNVVLQFVNEDGTPHSAQIIADQRPLPNMALDQPAIPRAYTRQAAEGIAQFGTDNVRFRATPPGDYLIFCGVPGHGISGMWIRLKVNAATTEASMELALRPGQDRAGGGSR